MITPGSRAYHARLLFLALMILAGAVILILRLYKVQVSEGKVYTGKLRDQTTVSVRLSPARGAIVDRNGVALAENRASFDVDFYLDELIRHYSRQHRGRLPKISTPGKHGAVTEPDIVKIVQESIDPISSSLGFDNRPDAEELRKHFRIRRDIPYQFRSDVDFVTLAKFSERNLGVPGIDIATRPVRNYNYGAFASHILGYVGKPDRSDQVGDDGYEHDTVGRQGIERLMDAHLQGKPGGKILRVNYRGYIDREEGFNPPTVGSSIMLTLDARVQHIAEQAMRGVGRGAAVVIDPSTGDVLALVSVPNYDPNQFIPKITPERWKSLNADPTAPLLNRAISPYAPGSTFKVLIALAALKSGAITPNTVIDCPPAIEIGGRLFRDHPGLANGLGPGVLYDALRLSCNVFFYKVGIKTGIQKIDEMGQLCGFGQSSEIPLSPEAPGIMPGPEWMKNSAFKRERWTTAHTANVSIGQGFLQVTPLQMTMLMGAVANGGTVYYPRLVQRIESINGEVQAAIPVRVRAELGLKKSDITAVRQALLGVVEAGTGRRAGGFPNVKVAGKTGSAQFTARINGSMMKDTRAWFYGFAPFENPRYALCIMVEGGVAGGVTAAPIAHEILQNLFAMEGGQQVAMDYMSPAVGHFNGVTEMDKPADPGAPGVPPAEGGGDPTIVPEQDIPSIMPKRRFF